MDADNKFEGGNLFVIQGIYCHSHRNNNSFYSDKDGNSLVVNYTNGDFQNDLYDDNDDSLAKDPLEITYDVNKEVDSKHLVQKINEIQFESQEIVTAFVKQELVDQEDFVNLCSEDSADKEIKDETEEYLFNTDDDGDLSEFMHFDHSYCIDYHIYSPITYSCFNEDEKSYLRKCWERFEKSFSNEKNKLAFSKKSQKRQKVFTCDILDICLYCSKLRANIYDHLKRYHYYEDEVWKALRSTKRQLEFLFIKNKGNFFHNKIVLKGKRTSAFSIPTSSFLPCLYCLAYFLKSKLSEHLCRCPFIIHSKKKYFKLQNKLLNYNNIDLEICKFTNEIHTYLPEIEYKLCSDVIKNDDVMKKFCSYLFCFGNRSKTKKETITMKMWEMAVLFIRVKEFNCAFKQLSDVFTPDNFEILVKAMNALCGKNDDNTFNNLALAMSLDDSIKKCISILKGDAINQNNTKKAKDCNILIALFYIHWSSIIPKRKP